MISHIPNPKVPGTYIRVDDLPQSFPVGGETVPTTKIAPAFVGTVESAEFDLSPYKFVAPENASEFRKEWLGHIAEIAREGKMGAGSDVPMGQSLYYRIATTGRADENSWISVDDLYAGPACSGIQSPRSTT